MQLSNTTSSWNFVNIGIYKCDLIVNWDYLGSLDL